MLAGPLAATIDTRSNRIFFFLLFVACDWLRILNTRLRGKTRCCHGSFRAWSAVSILQYSCRELFRKEKMAMDDRCDETFGHANWHCKAIDMRSRDHFIHRDTIDVDTVTISMVCRLMFNADKTQNAKVKRFRVHPPLPSTD